MAVHPQSVIPTWLQGFDSALYTALTNQENWSYLNPGSYTVDVPTPGTIINNTLAQWKAVFTELVGSITTWKNVNRQNSVADMLQIMLGAKALVDLYGFPINVNYPASGFTTMGGFVAACKGRPNNYYGDMVAGVSPKINADKSTIGTSGASEVAALASTTQTISGAMKPYSFKLTFGNVPIVGAFDKAATSTWIMGSAGLNYNNYFTYLNVGSLEPIS